MFKTSKFRHRKRIGLIFNDSHKVADNSSTIQVPQSSTVICHSCHKDKVESPTFNGNDKWDTFISLFEKVAEINQWEGSDRCKRLMVALRGSALEYVDTLQLKVTKDFDQLKAALASRFGVTSNESLYRVKFKVRRRRENESSDRFIQDLQYLAERAYPTEKGEIYHRLIVEQFIDGIGSKECKNYLQLNLNLCQETESKLIQEVLKYAHNYESVMGRADHVRKPYEGNANTFRQNDETRPKTPSQRPSQVSRTEHQSGNRHQRNPSKIVCYHCSGEGHIASRCPLKQEQEKAGKLKQATLAANRVAIDLKRPQSVSIGSTPVISESPINTIKR